MPNIVKTNSNKGSLSGYVNRGTSYLQGVNKIVLGLVSLFILLVLGIIVYWIYQAIQKSKKGDTENPILVAGAIDASDSTNSKSWVLPASSNYGYSSMAFTLSFWIYIADWEYRFKDRKAIIVKGKENGNSVTGNDDAPGIYLDTPTNNLIVNTTVAPTRGGIQNNVQVCNVANIPIQKWVHIAYVLDNRTVDVYVDCKLERSCILTGVPLLNNQKLHLFPLLRDQTKTGFMGQLSSLRYFSSALKPVDIANICSSGPQGTVGEQTKDHKPKKPKEDICSKKVFADLRKLKDNLASATEEVDDAIAQEDEEHQDKSEPTWDIKIHGSDEPVITQLPNYKGYKYSCQSGKCKPGKDGKYKEKSDCEKDCHD